MKKRNTWAEDLNDYLKTEGIKGKAFAARAGLNESTLSMLRHGKRLPTPEHMLAVSKASKGAVKVRRGRRLPPCSACGHVEGLV